MSLRFSGKLENFEVFYSCAGQPAHLLSENLHTYFIVSTNLLKWPSRMLSFSKVLFVVCKSRGARI